MASTEFEVVYDGPVLADRSMAVRDLAPALLALGDLFVDAGLITQPDQEPVSLNIRAAKDGSITVQLLLQSPDAWNQFVNIFGSKQITALVNLKELVVGSYGLFWLIQTIRGRPIVKRETLDSGMVRLTLEDEVTIEAPAETLTIYNLNLRRKAQKVIEPITKDGIDTLAFVSDETVTVSLEKQDASSFEAPEPQPVPLDTSVVTTTVEIVSPDFVEGNKWRLFDGETQFFAAIEDAAFLNSVEGGESFAKGDRLRCQMRTVQSEIEGKLHKERVVVKVEDHIHGTPQLSFDDVPEQLDSRPEPPPPRELPPGS